MNIKQDLPNIYYFILDAHPGLDLDALIPRARNAQFLAELQKTGFHLIAPTPSNYAHTNQTLAAIMALDYIPTNPSKPLYFYPESVEQGDAPPMLSALGALGYERYSTQSAAFGCQRRHVRCILKERHLDLHGVLTGLMSQTPLRSWKRLSQSLAAVDTLTLVQQRQAELLGLHRPFFLFAHHLSPHPPYRYSKDCKKRTAITPSNLGSGWSLADRPAFVAETICLDRDITGVVKSIIARDPMAIIVLQGDHGPWFGLKELATPVWPIPAQARQDRLSFLNLVRLPAKCRPGAGQKLGQINTARLVLACVSGKPPRFVDERSYMTNPLTGIIERVN